MENLVLIVIGLAIGFVFVAFIIKVGIDNSKMSDSIEKILNELKEIKQTLKDK